MVACCSGCGASTPGRPRAWRSAPQLPHAAALQPPRGAGAHRLGRPRGAPGRAVRPQPAAVRRAGRALRRRRRPGPAGASRPGPTSRAWTSASTSSSAPTAGVSRAALELAARVTEDRLDPGDPAAAAAHLLAAAGSAAARPHRRRDRRGRQPAAARRGHDRPVRRRRTRCIADPPGERRSGDPEHRHSVVPSRSRPLLPFPPPRLPTGGRADPGRRDAARGGDLAGTGHRAGPGPHGQRHPDLRGAGAAGRAVRPQRRHRRDVLRPSPDRGHRARRDACGSRAWSARTAAGWPSSTRSTSWSCPPGTRVSATLVLVPTAEVDRHLVDQTGYGHQRAPPDRWTRCSPSVLLPLATAVMAAKRDHLALVGRGPDLPGLPGRHHLARRADPGGASPPSQRACCSTGSSPRRCTPGPSTPRRTCSPWCCSSPSRSSSAARCTWQHGDPPPLPAARTRPAVLLSLARTVLGGEDSADRTCCTRLSDTLGGSAELRRAQRRRVGRPWPREVHRQPGQRRPMPYGQTCGCD